MNYLLLIIFCIAVVPFLGLPRVYDNWLYLVLTALLVYSIYRFVITHEIKFSVPMDEEGDFLRDEIALEAEHKK